jgi:ABC-type methionine transport system ATPase subunit
MRVPYVLKLLGLTAKAKSFPDQISGGEQQRVALARALVNNPSIIIADEPTGNIDPELSFEIVDLLSEINEQCGITILMVTHEHELVSYFNKRVVTIEDGRIVSDSKTGDARELFTGADIYEDHGRGLTSRQKARDYKLKPENTQGLPPIAVDFSKTTAEGLIKEYEDGRYIHGNTANAREVVGRKA